MGRVSRCPVNASLLNLEWTRLRFCAKTVHLWVMPAFSACESQQITNSRRDESYTIRFQVQVDGGDWTPMPEGYPMFDGKKTFTFRFAKFNKSLLYDPTLALGSTAENDPSGDDKPTGGVKTTASVCLASFFFALLVAIFH